MRIALLSVLCLGVNVAISATDLQLSRGEVLRGVSFAGLSNGIAEFQTSDGRELSVTPEELLQWGDEEIIGQASGILLTDGSFVVARIKSVVGESCSFSGYHLEGMVPLDRVRAIAMNMPVGFPSRMQLMREFRQAKGADDLFVLLNGSRLSGVFRGQGEKRSSWLVKVEGIERSVSTSALRGIVFSPVLHLMRPERRGFLVGFDDGSELSIVSISEGEQGCMVSLGGGAELRARQSKGLLLSSVSFIRASKPNVIFLSDIKPALYRQDSAFSSLKWPLGVDRACSGEPIAIRDVRFRKGLVMHAGAKAAWAIPAGASRFEASLGSQVVSGKESAGSIAFRVLGVDGEGNITQLFALPDVLVQDRSKHVSVKLGGARLVMLIVDDSGDGDAGDFGVWGDARFIEAEE